MILSLILHDLNMEKTDGEIAGAKYYHKKFDEKDMESFIDRGLGHYVLTQIDDVEAMLTPSAIKYLLDKDYGYTLFATIAFSKYIDFLNPDRMNDTRYELLKLFISLPNYLIKRLPGWADDGISIVCLKGQAINCMEKYNEKKQITKEEEADQIAAKFKMHSNSDNVKKLINAPHMEVNS